jgi:hypothetical protein
MREQRDRDQPWRAWNDSAPWRKVKQQLQKEPLCGFCERQGKVTAATVADHIAPRRGDEAQTRSAAP